MSNSSLRVAIIGAGMGGLSAAAALHRFGIHCEIYEQASAFARVGAGIHVGPNAVKVLRGLGVSEQTINEMAYIRPSAHMREAETGELTAEIELGEKAVREYGAPYTLWHRGDLHQVLAAAAAAVPIHRSRQVTGVDVGENSVTLSFRDGSRVTADAVVAADGVHSVVRRQIQGSEKPTFTGRVAYRTVIPRSAVAEPDLDPTCKWWGKDRHFVHYLVSAGRELAFTTSVPEDWDVESWSAEGDVEKLRAAFATFHPHVRSILAAVNKVNRWAIHTREPLDSWGVGNLVLLGDACHTMPPYMGQGAAMAMEDGVVLARCLAAVGAERDGVAEAFRRYEELRKPRTSKVQELANANVWGRYGWDGGWIYGHNAWEAPLEVDVGV